MKPADWDVIAIDAGIVGELTFRERNRGAALNTQAASVCANPRRDRWC